LERYPMLRSITSGSNSFKWTKEHENQIRHLINVNDSGRVLLNYCCNNKTPTNINMNTIDCKSSNIDPIGDGGGNHPNHGHVDIGNEDDGSDMSGPSSHPSFLSSSVVSPNRLREDGDSDDRTVTTDTSKRATASSRTNTRSDSSTVTVPISLWPTVFERINHRFIRGGNPFDYGCNNRMDPNKHAANGIYFLIRNNVGPVLRSPMITINDTCNDDDYHANNANGRKRRRCSGSSSIDDSANIDDDQENRRHNKPKKTKHT